MVKGSPEGKRRRRKSERQPNSMGEEFLIDFQKPWRSKFKILLGLARECSVWFFEISSISGFITLFRSASAIGVIFFFKEMRESSWFGGIKERRPRKIDTLSFLFNTGRMESIPEEILKTRLRHVSQALISSSCGVSKPRQDKTEENRR